MKIVSVVMNEDNKPVVGLAGFEKTRTQQSLADECDINKIVAKYEKTGLMSHLSSKVGMFGDFTNVVDFQTALNSVRKAEADFLGLPANIRERFDNDAGKLLAFLSDPKNGTEAVELGLAEIKVVKGNKVAEEGIPPLKADLDASGTAPKGEGKEA